jgi:CTP-dependent riboflavin kinase
VDGHARLSRDPEAVEIVAPIQLRKHMSLRNGNALEITPR